MNGYNIAFKVNDKTFFGRTQDDLTITPVTKSSLTKDDAGVEKKTVVRHDITFRAAGIITEDAGTSAKLSNTEIMDLALATGDTKLAIKYVKGTTTPVTYEGYAMITGYSESSNSSAEEDASYNLDMQVVGTLTKAVSGGGGTQ